MASTASSEGNPRIVIIDPNTNPHPAISDDSGAPPTNATTNQFRCDDNDIPILADHHDEPLQKLLLGFQIHSPDNLSVFLPQKSLETIMSRERLVKTLDESDLSASLADDILGSKTHNPGPKYLKVMAILCIMDRENEIEDWIRSGTNDESFPFWFDQVNNRLLSNGTGQSIQFLGNWKYCDYYFFHRCQWRLLTPYFTHNSSSETEPQVLDDHVILPFRKPSLADGLSWKERTRHYGGYGFVRGVIMPKSSHDFMPLLDKLDLKYNGFALKELDPLSVHGDDKMLKNSFHHEVKQLKRFGGHSEPHLVLLLASFQQCGKLYFLFPHAMCDLSEFWTKEPKGPRKEPGYMQWISRQFHGLMRATGTIHEGAVEVDTPSTLNPSVAQKGTPRYGRHGDIRPDNVLWFQSKVDPFGILVLSDMGLSTFNRENSKSNQPNRRESRIPVYHPPEAELEGGLINRTFDIWTLGCLFLEMVVWTLGGNEYLEEFARERNTVSHNQYPEKVFYEIKKTEPSVEEDSAKGLVSKAQVKDQVVECMSKLRKDPNCTTFIHQVLEIIEDKMLVVRPGTKERLTSSQLLPLFQRLTALSEADHCPAAI